MIDFTKKTLKSIMQLMLNKITNSIDKREGSIVYTVLAPIAYYLQEFYISLSVVQRDAYVETALGKALDFICAERGISRKPAVNAVKKVAFNIEVEIGSIFSTINGNDSLKYTITEYIDTDDTYFYYKAKCQTAGIVGNNYVGNLQAISVINGLTFAQMSDIIVAGSEVEGDESLRKRYIDSLVEKPFGGNIASYKEALLNKEGVGAVQVYPVWKGGGTVLCTILTTEYELANPELVKECQNLICPPEAPDEEPSINGYGVAPIGALATIKTGDKLSINIECDIVLKPDSMKSTVENAIKKRIEDYLLEIRKKWDNREDNEIKYIVTIVYSQILSTIVTTEGVMDVQNLKINGKTDNIICREDFTVQEVPFLGEFIVNEQN